MFVFLCICISECVIVRWGRSQTWSPKSLSLSLSLSVSRSLCLCLYMYAESNLVTSLCNNAQ